MDNEILVIDDCEDIRLLLNSWLSELGFHVTEAHNGAAGLKEIETKTFKLIITNLSMPEMDGFDVLRILKARANGTPVLVMSGSPLLKEALLKMALHLGARGILMKPFGFSEVKKAVSALLSGGVR